MSRESPVLFNEQLGSLCRFPDDIGDADTTVGTTGEKNAIGKQCVAGGDALFMADIVLGTPGWPTIDALEERGCLNAKKRPQFGSHGVEQCVVVEQHRFRAARAAVEDAKQGPSIRCAAIELL